jgi:diguanylate cyclase (GGDEF)-like protein
MSSVLRRASMQHGSPGLIGAVFLGTATVLCILVFLAPDLVRPGRWRLVFAGIILFLALNTLVVLPLRAMPDRHLLLDVLAVDVVIVLGAAALRDQDSRAVVSAIFALPTLYLALYAGAATMIPQGVAVVAGTVTITRLAGPLDVVAGAVVLSMLISVFIPVAAVRVLRERLGRALHEARRLSSTDPLTGLLNRRGLSERAPAVVSLARRAGRPVGVVVADVDHFKRVNDRYGHAVGDEVLRTVANAVSACVRPEDVVVRLGGEELVVLTAVGQTELIELAERIRHRVSVASRPYPVTVSLGVAWSDPYPPEEDPVECAWSLVDEADDLMYAAKRDGRNRVHSPSGVV